MGEVAFNPSFDRFEDGAGRELVRLGHPLVDGYLELVAARARPNTLLAQAYDLKVFFSIVDSDPVDVVAADVLRFISAQRQPPCGGERGPDRGRRVGSVSTDDQASVGHSRGAL